MKMYNFAICFITACLLSCDPGRYDESNNSILSGKYSGIFKRGEETGNVELDFYNHKFKGQSEKIKFPALCEGAYVIEKDSVYFENSCFWTAEFDWTLILNGAWKYETTEEELVLTNKLGDQYILTQE
ncbi:hypothetical protein [Zunongwangia sp. H14]|uniref:hypothetical protein n=1 Tax=Zunongwangia sp. H14 TaxID=3240792 RepID=UPI003566A53A